MYLVSFQDSGDCIGLSVFLYTFVVDDAVPIHTKSKVIDIPVCILVAPHDMIPYLDACGNRYDFAFGMNWSGVINDARVKKYKK